MNYAALPEEKKEIERARERKRYWDKKLTQAFISGKPLDKVRRYTTKYGVK